jgi:hypothetical protein
MIHPVPLSLTLSLYSYKIDGKEDLGDDSPALDAVDAHHEFQSTIAISDLASGRILARAPIGTMPAVLLVASVSAKPMPFHPDEVRARIK